MCAPPEEELFVDSCFDEGEAVGYKKVDDFLRLDAGNVGE